EPAADTEAPNPQVAQLGPDEDGTLLRQVLGADQEARDAHRCAERQKARVTQDCSVRRLLTVKPSAAKACATRRAAAGGNPEQIRAPCGRSRTASRGASSSSKFA